MFPDSRCDSGEYEKGSRLLLGGVVLQPWNVQCTDSKEQDHAESGYSSPRLSLIGILIHKLGVVVGDRLLYDK